MGYIIANVFPILAATAAGLAIGIAYHALQGGRGGRQGTIPTQPTVGFVLAALVAEFWLASILAGALILAPAQAGAWTMALGSAVVIWIGFVVPVLVVTNGFDRLPTRRGLANCVHWLAVILIQAAILQAVGLVKPT